MPTYPEYRDSGVEWLQSVPSHWEVKPARRLFNEKREPARLEDEQLSATQRYGVIPQRKFMEDEDQKVVLALAGTASFKHVQENDFVISLRSFQGGIEHSKYDGCVSPAYTVLRPSVAVAPRYWAYTLKSSSYISALQTVTAGIREGKSISYSQFGSLELPLPPLEEQSAISSMLNRETARIDALITEQEKLLALLAEKRQATISHAVTRGLDPDVPMRNSGIAWLGEIPTHWSTSRLKYVTDAIFDCPHSTPIYDADGEYLAIRTADLDRGVLTREGMYRLAQSEYEDRTRRSVLEAGDIVYGREGERWGHAALVPESDRYCLGQRMMQFRPSVGTCSEFLMWQLNSVGVYRQGELDTVGATSPHVNVSTIRNFELALPPLDEQEEIAAHLYAMASHFDCMDAEARRAISILRERRSALISAAVTGQIDVREHVLSKSFQ